MHELSLCQNAIELIEQQVRGQHVKKVLAVWFEAGMGASVEEDSLRFAFDCASQGTLLEGATVHFKLLPAKAWCWDCDKMVEIQSYGSSCPVCQGMNLKLDTMSDDMEFKVKQIEVE